MSKAKNPEPEHLKVEYCVHGITNYEFCFECSICEHDMSTGMYTHCFICHIEIWNKQIVCDHDNMVDTSEGHPNTGWMSGHCPDCEYSYHKTLY
jgi:hypothetical protein